MKLNKLLALLIMMSLTIGFYSCGEKKDEAKDNEKTEEVKNDTKSDVKFDKDTYVKMSKDMLEYVKSDDFYNMYKEIILNAVKEKPEEAMSKMQTAFMEKFMGKFLEMAKEYGFNSMEEMQAASKDFENAPELAGFENKMMTAMMDIQKKIMADDEVLGQLPAEMKAQFEQAAKMMEEAQNQPK